ncbi:Uncharacterized protein CH35J_001561 [Colletotrichum higginsianum]|uniref:T6SS Phospholipase effector Tle1-like catalytic domain-containing protein n=1 Tax=Colletotrichum higginsianum TaxID=80884 RepID=A0A4T0WJY6_9PEZI|nr:Uncharacterized protein CH35J_001561 [Colletotrichum higginsianum]
MSSETPNYVNCAHATAPQDGNFANRKRLVICCDGTWNNSNHDADSVPTNVSRLSAAVAHKCCTGMAQVVYYHRGPGTEEWSVASFMGGLLGLGVKQDIVDCYRFICDNYNPGDEIIIVGFSRGAFTARSIASMVCSLGFLNRTGLSYLGLIYKDYQSFNKWTDAKCYDKKKHLLGFNVDQLKLRVEKEYLDKILEIQKKKNEKDIPEDELWHLEHQLTRTLEERDRALTHCNLEKKLEEEKRELFVKLTAQKKNGVMKFRKMAKAYRKQLGRQVGDSEEFEAVEGRVKAVGIWDTVGSLGIPKMPWSLGKGRRSTDELRFVGTNIHPNIDHAFHGLALDEWRTPFGPTLWSRKDSNTNTKLRQVWFPGCHSNVGGGSNSQQISKIALAWMADQLTSVGVEFSKCEMKRIFSTISHGDEIRPWGLGKISSPDSLYTTLPDQAWSALTLPYRAYRGHQPESSVRRPGLSRNRRDDAFLTNTEELVHPSVRVRYLYHGLGLDDSAEWSCEALTGRGWQLSYQKMPPTKEQIRQGRDAGVVDEYKTVAGSVTAVHEQYAKDRSRAPDGTLVRTEHPSESELAKLNVPKNTWTWRQSELPGIRPLGEEQIGVWERMFIDVNDKLVKLQDECDREKTMQKTAGDRLRDLATEKVVRSLGMAQWIVKASLGVVFGAAPAKVFPVGYPLQHGYHDFVSWQRGLESGPAAAGVSGDVKAYLDMSNGHHQHEATEGHVPVHYHWQNDGTH